jgi:hypothetical protein
MLLSFSCRRDHGATIGGRAQSGNAARPNRLGNARHPGRRLAGWIATHSAVRMKQKWNKYGFSFKNSSLTALAILEQNGYTFPNATECWLH